MVVRLRQLAMLQAMMHEGALSLRCQVKLAALLQPVCEILNLSRCLIPKDSVLPVLLL